MLWLILSILVFGAGLVILFFKLGRQHLVVERQQRANVNIIKEEKETKETLLRQVALLVLGLESKEELAKAEKRQAEVEDSIRAEKGRLTITEAELEAVDTRLRELEELKRELEVSNMDAVKELDMLRSQEHDIAQKNNALKGELAASLHQLEELLDMLQHSAAVVEKLNYAKSQLVGAEKKCDYYQEQIAIINSKYMMLKKAYDALDIEYAQLYEKQQSAEDG